MKWNWQQNDWPNFTYDSTEMASLEAQFLRESGVILGAVRHLGDDDHDLLRVDLLTTEAQKTSEIEGEILDRDSLQSSIRRYFGLQIAKPKIRPQEAGISEMMVSLYKNFNQPLTHETLFSWHEMVANGRRDLIDIGRYRTHPEPMQVVSGSMHDPKIHFEAPPSEEVQEEMEHFINWFAKSASLPTLTRAGIAHLYFVSIHPFEDGNGRIGRALAEKAIAQNLDQPSLIALSYQIEKKRSAYYDALERANKDNVITDWLLYFGKMILEAQQTTLRQIEFLIEKTKFYDRLRGQLNERQEKVLQRMFREGIAGFKGGLSAENYLSITQTSRATATRDLADLVRKDAFIKTGQLKKTRYWLNLPCLLNENAEVSNRIEKG